MEKGLKPTSVVIDEKANIIAIYDRASLRDVMPNQKEFGGLDPHDTRETVIVMANKQFYPRAMPAAFAVIDGRDDVSYAEIRGCEGGDAELLAPFIKRILGPTAVRGHLGENGVIGL